jgi:hypothetical protein
MEFEKYLEREFMQQPPLFENDHFLEWKNKFENYVKSIDLDLWHIISIGDLKPTKMDFENQYNNLQTKFDKNTKAKLLIFKTLPRVEYERLFPYKTANDIWKYLLKFHQEKCKTKDDKLDIAHEIVTLENLIDKYLVEINTCTTSSNMVIEGTNNEEHMCQIRRKNVNKPWCNKDDEDDVDMAYMNFLTNANTSSDGKDCMLQDPSNTLNKTWSDMNNRIDHRRACEDCTTTNKVQSKTKHFCYDQFILEFSKLENNFKHFCNIESKTIFKNESSTSVENNFEKEIILEDKMSRLESNIEIDLECKICQDYKHEIKIEKEKAKILAKFENSSKSLKYLLNIQKSFYDKSGLGFTENDYLTNTSKQIKFVKPSGKI